MAKKTPPEMLILFGEYCKDVWSKHRHEKDFDEEYGVVFDSYDLKEDLIKFYTDAMEAIGYITKDDLELSKLHDEMTELTVKENYLTCLVGAAEVGYVFQNIFVQDNFRRCFAKIDKDTLKIIDKKLVKLGKLAEKILPRIKMAILDVEGTQTANDSLEVENKETEGDIPKGANKKRWNAILNGKRGDIVKCPYNKEHSVRVGDSRCVNCSDRSAKKKKDWIDVFLPTPIKGRR